VAATAALLDEALAKSSHHPDYCNNNNSKQSSSPTRVSDLSGALSADNQQKKRDVMHAQPAMNASPSNSSNLSKRRKVSRDENSTNEAAKTDHRQNNTSAAAAAGSSVGSRPSGRSVEATCPSSQQQQQPQAVISLSRRVSLQDGDRQETQLKPPVQNVQSPSMVNDRSSNTTIAPKVGSSSDNHSNAPTNNSTKKIPATNTTTSTASSSKPVNPLTANKKFKDGVQLSAEAEALVEAASAKMDIKLPEPTAPIVPNKGAEEATAEEMHRNRNREHAR
jgi:hypothetical protein